MECLLRARTEEQEEHEQRRLLPSDRPRFLSVPHRPRRSTCRNTERYRERLIIRNPTCLLAAARASIFLTARDNIERLYSLPRYRPSPFTLISRYYETPSSTGTGRAFHNRLSVARYRNSPGYFDRSASPISLF